MIEPLSLTLSLSLLSVLTHHLVRYDLEILLSVLSPAIPAALHISGAPEQTHYWQSEAPVWVEMELSAQ